MNPTGNTTADMIFTGFMLVVHLAALSGLGYLLGRMMGNRRAKTAETLAAMWERHAGDAMRRARLAEDQAEHYRRKGAVVRVVAEEMPEECRVNPSKWATWMNNQTRTMNMAGELAQAKIDRDFLKGLLSRAHYYIPASDLLWGEVLTAIKPSPQDHPGPSGPRVHPVVGRTSLPEQGEK